MDGLAYYRLKQVPVHAPDQKKAPITIEVSENAVTYKCTKCGKENPITVSSSVQCRYCDWRILEKPRTKVILKTV